MKIAHDILEIVILIISALGALVVAWGVIEAINSFVLIKFKTHKKDAVSASEEIINEVAFKVLIAYKNNNAFIILLTDISLFNRANNNFKFASRDIL